MTARETHPAMRLLFALSAVFCSLGALTSDAGKEEPAPAPVPAPAPAPAAPASGMPVLPTPGTQATPEGAPSGAERKVPEIVRAQQERDRQREAQIKQAIDDQRARPDDPEPVGRLVDLYMEAHDGPKAVAAAEAFVKSHPDSAVGLWQHGRALYYTGDFLRADLLLSRAATAAPGDARIQSWVARSRSLLGDPEGSIKAAEAALAVDPESGQGLVSKARALETLGRWAEAGKAWELVVAAKYKAGDQETRLLARSQMMAALSHRLLYKATWPEGAAPSATIPMRTFRGMPAIRVRLNDHVDRYLLVDFSTEDSIVTQDTAQALGLQGFGGAPKRPDVDVYPAPDFAILDSIHAGGFAVQGIPVAINTQLKYPHPDVGGLLGRSFFVRFLATLDYPGLTLTLAPPAAQPIEGVPAYYGGATLVPARASGGDAGPFVLDTSNSTPGPVSIIFAEKRLGLNVMSQGVRPILNGPYTFSFTMNDLMVGNVIWKQFRATGVDLRSLSERIGVEISGVLGNQQLADTRITADFAHSRVRLDRAREQIWKSPSKLQEPPQPAAPAAQAPATATGAAAQAPDTP